MKAQGLTAGADLTKVRLPVPGGTVCPLSPAAKTRYTKGMKNQETTLAQRVADHYEDCLGCNGSWCNFTSELGVLNLFDVLDPENYWFVAELMMDGEEFEDEDFDEMVEAIGEFLADRKVPAAYVYAGDLERVPWETGFDPEDIARFAVKAGVPEKEILAYIMEALDDEPDA